jgi:probable HAF family extracellular repeat protein
MRFRPATGALVAALAAALLAAPAARAQYTFTPIALPSPGSFSIQWPSDINNAGQIVGTYNTSNGVWYGFLNDGSTATTLSQSNGCCADTWANGMNDVSDIVGTWAIGDGGHIGFLYRDGVFTTIRVDGLFLRTDLIGINNAGQIIGYYTDGSDGSVHGFLYEQGAFAPLAYVPTGLNDAGQIVGYYMTDPRTFSPQGVLDEHGTLTLLSYVPYGINNPGQIVGRLRAPGPTQSVVDDHGAITGFALPGAISTVVTGINDAGQIVGYGLNGGTSRPVVFLATPVTAAPEPATWALLGAGLLVFGAVTRLRPRA